MGEGRGLCLPAKTSLEFEASGCCAPETQSGTHLDTHLLWLIACFAQCIHFIISFKWAKTTRIRALSRAVMRQNIKGGRLIIKYLVLLIFHFFHEIISDLFLLLLTINRIFFPLLQGSTRKLWWSAFITTNRSTQKSPVKGKHAGVMIRPCCLENSALSCHWVNSGVALCCTVSCH